MLISNANSLGIFVAMDENSLHSFDKRMARVLVELDVSFGLHLEIDILWDDEVHLQKLDYQNTSYRCHYCNETTHLRNKFLSLLHRSNVV